MGHSTTEHGASHGSVGEYIVGLLLSIGLTALPFFMVMSGDFDRTLTIITIFVCAVAQVLVQLVFFLHMNNASEQWWNIITAIFVVVLVAILIVGSIWVMQNMNHNMLMGH
ncbi:MAG TPA: cytochrome o ubiquinol oxidase subunit IV [Gammaproteobacteria bacterium]|nr:cytochrome o ubiquinol oxidase subunit IV [Gammaproteobacteria bacterium]